MIRQIALTVRGWRSNTRAVKILMLGALAGAMLASGAYLRPTVADEGMWLFNDLPLAYLKEKYDFEPSPGWTENLMKASVRFNSGGSASFVSADGLVLTNHHVGADTLHKLSEAGRNLYDDGFLAASLEDELRAPDLELNQLVSIEDVTDKIQAAVQSNMTAAEASRARQAAMSVIENESLEKTGLRSDVITLYGGAKYHLYRYKRYTDVRLVWSPESAIAFFGGDADNFEYPRYCLDVCLFRVYENDRPAKIEHYLKFSTTLKNEELVFVSGNPGSTNRIYTVAALKHLRDTWLPYFMNYLRRQEIMLQQFGLEGEEQTRRAKDDLFSIQNSRKAVHGELSGMQDPEFFKAKRQREAALLQRIKEDPQLRTHAVAWDKIAAAQNRRAALQGMSPSINGRLFNLAETLVRMAEEDAKPSPERLREFRDSNRESLEQDLFSTAPIYADLEQAKLADSLARMAERFGGDYPLVRKVLSGKSPQDRAAALVQGSKLFDVDYRRALAKGGKSAIDESQDPMLILARLVDPRAREIRKEFEEIQEVERQAYAQIAEVLFAEEGTASYPDATFTLRLAFGPVRGYQEGGRSIAAWTTLGGAFESEAAHGAREPWKLPESWHKAKSKLNLETPFNFVCTADIIGGNSGSPVVNRAGELVGVIFDGNIQSLAADYMYSAEQARAVSVASLAVMEALQKVYGAERIVKELTK